MKTNTSRLAFEKGLTFFELLKVYEKANNFKISDEIPPSEDEELGYGFFIFCSVARFFLILACLAFLIQSMALSSLLPLLPAIVLLIIAEGIKAGVKQCRSERMSKQHERDKLEWLKRDFWQFAHHLSEFSPDGAIENAVSQTDLRKAILLKAASQITDRQDLSVFVDLLFNLGFEKQLVDEFYTDVFPKTK